MEENTLPDSELSKLRRSMGLSEPPTPGTFRTRTTTGIRWPLPSEAALREHKQRGEKHVARLQQLLRMHPGAPMVASKPQPKQNAQERSIEPAATPAVPPVEPQRRRQPDNSDPPESVAKPWKKPWDK